MNNKAKDLLEDELIVINIGLPEFANDLEAQKVKSIHVDWSPPLQIDEELSRILDKLL